MFLKNKKENNNTMVKEFQLKEIHRVHPYGFHILQLLLSSILGRKHPLFFQSFSAASMTKMSSVRIVMKQQITARIHSKNQLDLMQQQIGGRSQV